MKDENLTICELGLMELNLCRLGFAPNDSRSEVGTGSYGPRYAYVDDLADVVLYSEEVEVAGQLNLEIEKGATFKHTIRWQQVNGEPVDVTGCTALLQVRKTQSPTGDHIISIASYTEPIGAPTPWRVDITITEASGQFDIDVPATVTDDLEAGEWYYDMKVTLVGGEVYRLIEGRMTIDEQVTA
jgi:hypothetical protein